MLSRSPKTVRLDADSYATVAEIAISCLGLPMILAIGARL